MSSPETSAVEPQQGGIGCGILGRNPIISVITFAAMGVAVGIGLSEWEPDNEEVKMNTLKWIGLFGDLFIRALKAVVLPLVFVNVAVSIVDMMMMGRASNVGVKTIALYTLTTFLASTIGLISILIFKGQFEEGDFEEPSKAFISLGCTEAGSLLTESEVDGSLMCTPDANATSPYAAFEILDLTASLATNEGGLADLTMSETIYDGVFLKLITSNIFYDFVDGNFAAVIVFAIVFGVALGCMVFEKGHKDINASTVLSFFTEISEVLLKIINWIIACTPFAVLSLISNAIGSQDDLSGAFSNVGWLIAANLMGYLAHFVITDIGIFYLLSGWNPIEYLRFIVPAQTTALACASSAATLPVTLRCVKNTGKIPDDIRNFVCPLGATINMDGSAIYFPCACIWLAVLNGIKPDAGSYILLIILSTIGSAGAAPVPSSGLVLVITAYNTVFGTSGTPNGFEFIVAIDWFLDRCITALNVTGDTVVCGIIASRTPFEDEEEDTNNDTKTMDKVELDSEE
mmetsp:Transcript_1577/g.2242  ORF Transcript_1577/g.2242 Transcript_1577/m.2242 type:complete len:516 (+) Transcript_1577:66-1613(+)|eukprot:CAMPEP_0198147850 /NCGR_PEP_ID=MMETSP1443-20131203/38163_1 /TAXON_ID=186043 /ORGANISM="Entomoneis sp., Strain CCMP2396" /LENGTH=515 /DNA_ID=CAMNT_0043812351 /DNA_START=63 /DNA_END=1610 /DNA_ORIENTATION=-